MEGDVLAGLMRWQVAVWLIGAAVGAAVLMARAFANRLVREIETKLARIERVADEISRIDAELAKLRAELPVHYVRRDDHVRDITTVAVKLDRIYELLLVRGTRHD